MKKQLSISDFAVEGWIKRAEKLQLKNAALQQAAHASQYIPKPRLKALNVFCKNVAVFVTKSSEYVAQLRDASARLVSDEFKSDPIGAMQASYDKNIVPAVAKVKATFAMLSKHFPGKATPENDKQQLPSVAVGFSHCPALPEHNTYVGNDSNSPPRVLPRN